MLSPNELAIEWGRNCSMKEFLVKKYKLEYQTLENFDTNHAEIEYYIRCGLILGRLQTNISTEYGSGEISPSEEILMSLKDLNSIQYYCDNYYKNLLKVPKKAVYDKSRGSFMTLRSTLFKSQIEFNNSNNNMKVIIYIIYKLFI